MSRIEVATSGAGRRARAASSSGSSSKRNCRLAKGKPSIKIVPYKEDPLGVVALQTGNIDVYESDSPPAAWYTTKNHAIQIVGKPITPQPVGIAIAPKNTALKAQIQKAITTMYTNGSMSKILVKWNMTQFALKK